MTREKKHHLEGETVKSTYRNLIIGFSVAAILLFAVILYFVFSRATVYITPNYQYQKIGFAIQVAKENSDSALAQNRLSGKVVETSASVTKTFAGVETRLTTDKASGKVIIYNKNSQAQVLVATTRLLTADNKLYRIENRVNIPAGGQVEVIAKADQAGDEFIIGPGRLTIPGLWVGLQDKIYAESVDGFKKDGAIVTNVTDDTIATAKTELNKTALEDARKKLSSLAGKDIPLEALEIKNTVFTSNAKPNTNQKEFTGTMTATVKALIFDEQEMKNLALATLPPIYKADNALINIDQQSFSYQVVILDNNQENLLGQIKGEYTVKLTAIKVQPTEIAGLSRSEALKYLKNLPNVKDASILMPFWSRSLPVLGDKITIQIKE
jgi:hypothetical protein